MSPKDATSTTLTEALKQIDAAFGQGSIHRLGSQAAASVDVIPTGSIALDQALGIGGYPRGRIVEIFGPESSGKSTLALHAVANAQKFGTAAYLDTEHSIDPEYSRALGVDTDNLLIAQPDTAEQTLEIAQMLIDSDEISIIVLDSVAAMVPRAELEGNFGDSNVGLHARIMSQAMRKLTGRLSKTNTILLAINQLRQKIGQVYGPSEVTTGGIALKYYSSVRLDIRRIETEKLGSDAVGNRTRVKAVKNKLAAPLKIAEFSIIYGEGISRETELLDMGVDKGVVRRSGAWYSYGDTQLGQGKEKSRLWLVGHPETANEIEQAISKGILT